MSGVTQPAVINMHTVALEPGPLPEKNDTGLLPAAWKATGALCGVSQPAKFMVHRSVLLSCLALTKLLLRGLPAVNTADSTGEHATGVLEASLMTTIP